ncbi:thiamine phosphate synthase [bacterium]|nr:thiamine phosphate synthase [bacterium]
MNKQDLDYSLYLVTDRSLTLGRDLLYIIEEAILGGTTMIQLREKSSSSRAFYDLALKVKKITLKYNIPLIINDRLDIALAVEADGLHIGQSDLPYSVARSILGPKAIIGLSVESVQDALDADSLDVDYLGISPVFSTNTKRDTAIPLGIEGVRDIKSISRHKLVAIGGINLENSQAIIKAGADGLALVSAICSADSPRKASEDLLRQIIKSKK